MVWALDPDDEGRIVWKARIGAGDLLGGAQWGTATDRKAVYAAVSDLEPLSLAPIVFDPNRGGGLHALTAATGAALWSAPVRADIRDELRPPPDRAVPGSPRAFAAPAE